MTAADIAASCDASLKRLKTDVIDLYQIHWPERHVPAFGSIYYDPTKEKSSTSIHEQSARNFNKYDLAEFQQSD